MSRNTPSALRPFDLLEQFEVELTPPTGALPWPDIATFATHPSFCGLRLYPRQLTLLRLIYLETETMTAYDLDVIEQWREGWRNPAEPCGVQDDIWERVRYLKERGYRHFPHVEALVGRRGSKGLIGGILGAEKIAQFYALDNWQEHYGIARGKDGFLQVVATSLNQAKKYQFADIRETVEGCKYLERAIVVSSSAEIVVRTPADARRLAYMQARKMPVDHLVATLHAVALSSSSASGRGGTAFVNMFDELAHQISGTGSQKSSEEIYEAFQPSLDQFGADSLTFVPTSPYTKIGRAYSLYTEGQAPMSTYDPRTGTERIEMVDLRQLGITREQAHEQYVELAANPEMLVVQLPSWGLYEDWQHSESLGGPRITRPIAAYDERMQRLEQANPDKFSVERRAQFASVLNAYLNPRKVEAMFALPDWLESAGPVHRGRLDIPYRIHVDPSTTNANFAVTVAHLVLAPPDAHGEVWPHVVTDFMHVWRPEDFPEHIVDYVEIGESLKALLHRFPSTTHFTFDQWNSAGFIAALRQEFPHVRIAEETFSQPGNKVRMERFKTALYLGWVHAYRDNFYDQEDGSLLEMELKFLHRKPNGVIDKQDFGPVTTKDLADTVMVVTDKLLGDDLDRWYEKQLSAVPVVGSSNVSALRGGREEDRLAAFRGEQPTPLTRGWDAAARNTSAREQLAALSRPGRTVGTPAVASLRSTVRAPHHGSRTRR